LTPRLLPPLLLALLSGACAGSRMGDAEVRLQQGQPCFGVTASEAAAAPSLALNALLVHDLAVQPPRQVWSLLVRPQAAALPLDAAACVPFGQVPPGYDAEPALPLQAGRAYEVYLNAAPERGRRVRQGYNARFCLLGGTQLQALAPNSISCRP
jgi:hypothetical protein